jgi:hypothetical protein
MNEKGNKKMTHAKSLLSVVLIALAPAALHAQDVEQATEEALETLGQMSVEVNNFVGDVRFDESDVLSLIELWEEYNEFGANQYDDEETIDFESILSDGAYRSWAASNGLDGDDWLQKTVRITMALYREQMLEAARTMPEQMAQQMRMRAACPNQRRPNRGYWTSIVPNS